jgi:hypothetical protein
MACYVLVDKEASLLAFRVALLPASGCAVISAAMD